MECKICERELPVKNFPKRIIGGTGQVLRVCANCDNSDITELAREVVKVLDIDVNSYVDVGVRRHV
jgi:hypothetical protein